jgi:hypothetical protein
MQQQQQAMIRPKAAFQHPSTLLLRPKRLPELLLHTMSHLGLLGRWLATLDQQSTYFLIMLECCLH